MRSPSKLSSVVIACPVDGACTPTGRSTPSTPPSVEITEPVRGMNSCPPLSIIRQRVDHRRARGCVQGIAACQERLYADLLASFDRIALLRRDASRTTEAPESYRVRLLEANNEIMTLQLAIGSHVQALQDLFNSATHVTEVERQVERQ